jgi:hypothetical protein
MAALIDTEGSGTPLSGADRAAIGIGLLSLAAGLVLLLAAHGFVAEIVGACLIGLAGIAFVALAFLLVGEAEDRHYGKRRR